MKCVLCCVNVSTWLVLALSYDEAIQIEHLKATSTNCAILLVESLISTFASDCVAEIINEIKQNKNAYNVFDYNLSATPDFQLTGYV